MPVSLGIGLPTPTTTGSGTPGEIPIGTGTAAPAGNAPNIRYNNVAQAYETWNPVSLAWEAAALTDVFVDTAGDVMTGTLNMSNNEIENTVLRAGTF
jgi:hypothetical protein